MVIFHYKWWFSLSDLWQIIPHASRPSLTLAICKEITVARGELQAIFP
jgi:hypothetical protein